MNRLITAIIIVIGAALTAGAITTQQALSRAADKLRTSASTRVAYTLTADGHAYEGMLTIAGERFTVSSPQMSSWYDGKTQWTYSQQMGEVNVITPTPDEVQQINPFAIIRSLGKDYSQTALPAPKGQTAVRLTATSKTNDIRTADIVFSDATAMPLSLSITLSGGQVIKIKVNSITPGGALPTGFFKFDPAKYPGVQVVDLR